jgi:hypothetical protein
MAVMPNRALAPNDNDASGGVQVLFNILMPVSSSADVRVPPYREALVFQRFDERCEPCSIFNLV